jgi:filamentous hemagglutinin family protein
MHCAAFIPKSERLKPWRVLSALGLSLLLVFGQTVPVLGNPTGGDVVAGSASISSAGKTLSINQASNTAIINWQTFSIGSGELTKFLVPNSSSATLNRVLGGNPSAIYGTLQSNGQLFLINPNGIVVGAGGRIDTAGFLGSTLDVSNDQFLKSGNLNFLGSSDASINNQGIINASSGDVYLIAGQVSNSGTITASRGNVGLAAGSNVLYQPVGDQHLFIQSNPTGTTRAIGVTNTGTIRAASAELKAAGGNAYALAINNTGNIAATGYKKVNGQVYLTADGGNITNSGTISAKQANGNGGTIGLNGSGTSSTGTVLNSGTLNASATAAGGQGGSVTLKNSGGTTIHSGKILARGGQGGVGGNVDVSGGSVQLTGAVDTTAPGGQTGMLLIDPTTWTVAPTGGDETGAQVATALGSSNVTLNANDAVVINDSITWTAATTLILSTNNSSSAIAIEQPISGVNGGLTLAGFTDSVPIAATAAINVANFILQHGIWTQDSASLPGFTASNDFELQNSSTFIRVTGGNGSSGTPYQIADIYGLQGLASPSGTLLGLNFELTKSIDATGTSTWNSGAGFTPIGNNNTASFIGTFNGQGNVVNGLSIDQGGGIAVGLFGQIDAGALIENVGVTNAQVVGDSSVGALVGAIRTGTVTDSFSGGTVEATGGDLGGLVGYSYGTISNAYSTAAVHGDEGSINIGGLLGLNDSGTITNTYSSGAVTVGTGTGRVGGLVGLNNPGSVINNSFWDTTTSGLSVGVGSGSTTGTMGDPTTTLLSQATYTTTSNNGPAWNIGTDPTTNTWVIFDGQTRPMLAMEYSTTITNAHQLQLIGLNATTLAASYTVANNIDLSGTTNASDVWGTSTTNSGGWLRADWEPNRRPNFYRHVQRAGAHDQRSVYRYAQRLLTLVCLA